MTAQATDVPGSRHLPDARRSLCPVSDSDLFHSCPKSTGCCGRPCAPSATTRSRRGPPRSTRRASSRRTSYEALGGRLPRGARAGGVRRCGRGRARHVHRHRGGRPGLRLDLADPGGQQARHDAAAALGSEDLLKRVPAGGRQRRGDVLLRAVRARGRQRRGGDEDARPCATATTTCSTAPKRWITNAGVSEYYTVMAVTDADAGRERHLGVRRGEVRRGLLVRRAGEEARHQGVADPRAVLRRLPHPGGPAGRRGGHRLQDRAGHARPHPHHDRRAGGRHRPGALGYAIGYVKERKQFGKAIAEFQGDAVHARRHGDEGRDGAADDLRRGRQVRAR